MSGLYYFSLTLTKYGGHPGYDAACYLIRNTNNHIVYLVYAAIEPHTDTGYFSSTNSLTINLKSTDTVYVGHCENPQDIVDGDASSFTGFLVAADGLSSANTLDSI